MNAVRCPQCGLINQTSAVECQQCRFPFTHLPDTAFVSVPATDYERTLGYYAPPPIINAPAIFPDNETGRKTHFWYKIYCALMALLYLAVFGIGIFLTVMATQAPLGMRRNDPPFAIVGPIYAFMGLLFAIPFIGALFLPRTPWNWVVGIVLIALGMTSICCLPALIPLLIYWLKPETQAYFGRNNM